MAPGNGFHRCCSLAPSLFLALPSVSYLQDVVVFPFSPMRCVMKAILVLSTGFIVLLTISLALANPTLLPKHPGYPMGKAVDPVSGQSLANDPGQPNATGENSLGQASRFDDVHVKQNLSINQNDQRLLEKPGAGLLPKVQGPNIKIDPPVKEATKMSASPK
jgi:hypothetical protein